MQSCLRIGVAFFIFLITSSHLIAQGICVTTDQLYSNPHLQSKLQFQDALDLRVREAGQSRSFGAPPQYELPVVFHVISDLGPGIPDNQILTSLQYLNEAFENIGYYNPQTGVNVEVNFCLAQRDPQGNITSGINRVRSNLGTLILENDDVSMKDLSRWDPLRYINIWVVDEIISISAGAGVAGYAFFPSSHGDPNDGIVVEGQFTGVDRAFNGVLVHEMGHYLGLYHTFQGGCKNDDCTVDGDQVCDTPPDQSTAYVGCSDRANTCSTDQQSGFNSDQDDMIQNYMDYSRLECYDRFTQGQKDRMRFFIEGARSSLLQSLGCSAPCQNPINVNIDVASRNLIVCDSLTFSTSGDRASTFEWYYNQRLISNRENDKFEVIAPGSYDLILVAYNADRTCVRRDTVTVNVRCAFELMIEKEPASCIPSGAVAEYQIGNVGSANIIWTLDNSAVGMNEDQDLLLADGVYQLKVKVSDLKCSDSLEWTVLVGCTEICDNGFDDDLDGLFDCFDDDCCSECADYYYDACFENVIDCIEPIAFSIKKKWRSVEADYFKEGQLVCGDVDGDGLAEIVSPEARNIRFYDIDGSLKKNLRIPHRVSTSFAPALVDINRDGVAEYIFVDGTNQNIVAIDYNGNEIFVSPFPWIRVNIAERINVYDLNLDGVPEIELNLTILDAAGNLLFTPIAGTEFAENNSLRINADILPDNACAYCEGQELVFSDKILAFNDDFTDYEIPVRIDRANAGSAGVSDWDSDGDLDVIGMHKNGTTEKMIVWDGQTTTVLHSFIIDDNRGNNSSPTIGNFDQDDEPEVAFTQWATRSIILLDNDFTQVWEIALDEPSSITATAFDFNNDGIQELAVRDNQNLVVIDAMTEQKLTSLGCKSITNSEKVIIADLDGDEHAELACYCGAELNESGWIQVYEGSTREWPKTRNMFFNYYNNGLCINDDLTIPTYAQQNHLPKNGYNFLNGYHNQIAIPEVFDTLELSALKKEIKCNGDSLELTFEICKSSNVVPNEINVTFYEGDPSMAGSQRLETRLINTSGLNNMDCINVVVQLPFNLLNGLGQICCIVNDEGTRPLPFDFTDGLGFGGLGECDYINNIICFDISIEEKNLIELEDIYLCQGQEIVGVVDTFESYLWSTGSTDHEVIIDQPGPYYLEVSAGCGITDRDSFNVFRIATPSLNLPDTLRICPGGIEIIQAAPGFKEYLWSTGERDPSITVFNPGKVRLSVVDSCDNILKDSVQIILLPDLPIIFPDTLFLCSIDSFVAEVIGHEYVQWSPSHWVECDSCLETKLNYDSSGWLTAYVANSEGCSGSDSMYISFSGSERIQDSVEICFGELYPFRDTLLGEGRHEWNIEGSGECDTMLRLFVTLKKPDTTDILAMICPGDSIELQNEFYTAGRYLVEHNVNQCDSIIALTVDEYQVERARISIDLDSCEIENSTVSIGGMSEGELSYPDGSVRMGNQFDNIVNGSYRLISSDNNGCNSLDTNFTINLNGPYRYDIPSPITIELGDTIRLAITGDIGGIDTIMWSPDNGLLCGDCERLLANPSKDITYEVVIIDLNGCIHRLFVMVKVEDNTKVFVPNTFSPNGDGINDYLGIHSSNGDVFISSFEVYSRWGELLYRENGVEIADFIGWNGEFHNLRVSPGVYVYFLSYTSANNSQQVKSGSITVLE